MENAILPRIMKKLLFTPLLFAAHCLYSQVSISPNPFMETGVSPNSLGGIQFCQGYSTYLGNPDYFRHPEFGTGTGVPDNAFGYQQDLNSGSAYAGFVGYSDILDYGSVRSALSQPTVPGHRYEVNIALSLANSSSYTCDGVGFSLGGETLYLPPFLSDTASWSIYSDTITASAESSHIVVGQMISDTSMITRPRLDADGPWAYFYLGWCQVSDLSIPATAKDVTVGRGWELVQLYSMQGLPVPPSSRGLVVAEYARGLQVCRKLAYIMD